jgi:hypothetical protein
MITNNEHAKRNIQRAVNHISEAMGWLDGAAQKAPGISGSLHQATYELAKVISRLQDDADRVG